MPLGGCHGDTCVTPRRFQGRRPSGNALFYDSIVLVGSHARITPSFRLPARLSYRSRPDPDDKAVVGFVGWGGLDAQENRKEAGEADSVPVMSDSDEEDAERVPPVESDVGKHRGGEGEDQAEENDT